MTEPASKDLDEHLRASLIGGFEPRKVEIVDYDPQWPRRFEKESSRIRATLGTTVGSIEHIGSTSVPDLAAKPVVDILITVADVEDEDAYRVALEGLGYELRVKESGHRAFRTRERDVNLHVWGNEDPEVPKHLLFRDHLRKDAADRTLYEEVKRELATREWPDINYYAEAKNEIIAQILDRARQPD